MHYERAISVRMLCGDFCFEALVRAQIDGVGLTAAWLSLLQSLSFKLLLH